VIIPLTKCEKDAMVRKYVSGDAFENEGEAAAKSTSQGLLPGAPTFKEG